MKELERLEAELAKVTERPGYMSVVTVPAADLKAVCSELRNRITRSMTRPGIDPKLFAEDKKLIERIEKFGKDLRKSESDFMENAVQWIEDGKALTPPMRRFAEDIDRKRVGA